MNTSRGSSPFAAPSEGRRRRWRSLLMTLSVALGLGLVLGAMLMASAFIGEVRAGPLCVNTTGAGGCYTKIQDAIDAASGGTVITVDAGTYTEHITMTDGVSIHGQGWPSTIIDGGYSMPRATVYIPSGVSASTVLSGVQITGGGTGDLTTSVQNGGGIQIEYASPSIVNTWVYSCTARYGGGVFVNSGSPTFDNVPVWNSRAESGGGFYLQNGAEVTITSDFVGTNGTVWWNSAIQEGGGFYMFGVTATLSGLRIWWNEASGNPTPSGGGVYISNTPNRTTLLLNDISGNSAPMGGGIRTLNATNLEIVGNVINGNTATDGGGGAAFGQSAGLVQTNGFIGNTSSGGVGGGVTVFGSSTGLTLQGNWFQGNSAGAGGGLNLDAGAAPLVDANTFVTNTAPMGGGIYTYLAGAAEMTNNIVARNTASGAGGGVAIVESPLQLINNTIADNTLDGVYFVEAEGVVIVNNIISGNSDDGIENYTVGVNPTVSYTVAYNDVYGNANPYRDLTPGAGNISVDPQFVGTGPNLTAYYHITNTSPVSATGSISWAPARDIDGELRISGGSVSMGADEIPGGAEYTIYLPAVMRNYH